jgi:hypothetical protein
MYASFLSISRALHLDFLNSLVKAIFSTTFQYLLLGFFPGEMMETQ